MAWNNINQRIIVILVVYTTVHFLPISINVKYSIMKSLFLHAIDLFIIWQLQLMSKINYQLSVKFMIDISNLSNNSTKIK